jgi:hypothetical protein
VQVKRRSMEGGGGAETTAFTADDTLCVVVLPSNGVRDKRAY